MKMACKLAGTPTTLILDNVTFDKAGEGLQSVRSYVTARDLTDSTTFYGIRFDNNRPGGTSTTSRAGVDANLD